MCPVVHKMDGGRDEHQLVFQVPAFVAAVRREVQAQMSLHLRQLRIAASIGELLHRRSVGEPMG